MKQDINLMNFLYCFDINYQKQSFSSILSLLNNVSVPVKIHIIHNDQKIPNNIPKIIKEHKFLSSIECYFFELPNQIFPNIDNTHVSEATYFRIFINKYLNENIRLITYLDGDTICISNPIEELKNAFRQMNKEQFVIAAKTELKKSEIVNFETLHYKAPEIPFVRLPIAEKYFNAGVMCIDLELWRENNIEETLLNVLNEHQKNLFNWDQDVLNTVFNGNYTELKNSLNFYNVDIKKIDDLKDVNIIHFVGSKKPWNPSPKIGYSDYYYHYYFRLIDENFFHIIHKWKLKSIQYLFNSIFNLSILKIKYPARYIIEFILSLIKKL